MSNSMGNLEDIQRQIKLKNKYKTKGFGWSIILAILILSLFIFAQFGIVENYFKNEFKLRDSAEIFGIPVRSLIGFFVTGILPIASIIDESKILGKSSLRIKIPILFGKSEFSAIWLVFATDLILIFLSLYSSNPGVQISPIAPLAAAIGCSISIIFISRGIVHFAKRAYQSWKDYQDVELRGIDPDREAEENLRLTCERDEARQESDSLKQKLSELNLDLENKEKEIHDVKDEVSFRDQQIFIQQNDLDKLRNELSQSNNRNSEYELYIKDLRQLKRDFSKVKKSFQEILPTTKSLPAKLIEIDKSIDGFIFPEIDISKFSRSAAATNNVPVSEPVQSSQQSARRNQVRWKPDDIGWESLWANFNLPNMRLSPPIANFLRELQAAILPPPEVGFYTPQADGNRQIPSCSTLSFSKDIVVFCRDETLFFEDEVGIERGWNELEEESFKQYTTFVYPFENGKISLVCTCKQMFPDPSARIQEIKAAINSISKDHED